MQGNRIRKLSEKAAVAAYWSAAHESDEEGVLHHERPKMPNCMSTREEVD